MSKPQMASEPSMEDILASIRKMISDDKPGPSPMPDVMGRTPFGESSRGNSAVALGAGSPADISAAGRSRTQSGPNFNSLADALKVATTLSDQRRALQQEIAEVLDKSPRNNLEALTELSAARNEAARSLLDETKKAGGSASASQPAAANSPAGADAKPDLLGFDFGTMVPLGENATRPKPGEEKPSGASVSGVGTQTDAATKGDAKAEPSADSRVLPLRTGFNGSSSPLNVAPFPRPTRETGKTGDSEPVTEVFPAASAPATAKPKEPAAEPAMANLEPSAPAMAGLFKGDTLDKHGEALLDAVVDLVQQKPGALSVFASGDSFINGSGGKKPSAKLPVIAEATEVVDASASGVPAPKLDRAAAELLRPMLRQWLSENMERILEDALRSELSDKVSGKEPEKG